MAYDRCVVLKKLSKQQWYYGETHPLTKLRTRSTFLVCIGLGPKLSPRCPRGDQRGRWFPDVSAFCKANTGQPKVCTCFMLLPTQIQLKSSSHDVPPSSTGRLLWRWAAIVQHIWPQGKVDCLWPAGACVEQFLARALREVTDGLLGNANSESAHSHNKS